MIYVKCYAGPRAGTQLGAGVQASKGHACHPRAAMRAAFHQYTVARLRPCTLIF